MPFIRKNLLIEVEPDILEISSVNHVVLGLPSFIENKTTKKMTISQKTLITELNTLEALVKKDSKPFKMYAESKLETQKSNSDRPPINKKPCSFCAKLGFKDKVHPETKCWNNSKSGVEKPDWLKSKINKVNGDVRNNVKLTNNTELELIVNADPTTKN